MGAEPLADLTMGRVATRAGVTERTVFRHFPTREALIEAVWPYMQQRVGSPGFPSTVTAAVELPHSLFPSFDQHHGLILASLYSEAGIEMRLGANKQRKAALLACVKDAYPDIGTDAAYRLAAIVQLIGSGYGWSVMKDFWGFDGAEAGRAASEALAVLLGVQPAGSSKTRHAPLKTGSGKKKEKKS